MANMLFSETKKFVGVYEKGIVTIKQTDTGIVIAKFNENENDANKTIEKYMKVLEDSSQNIPYQNMNEIEKMIEGYKDYPTSEKELKLKIILFFMKKMEYMNKKVYKISEYVELIENIGIKLEKGWNPFENK